MSGSLKRREFLKMMGLGGAAGTLAGCDLPSTVTLEEGKEDVVSYFMPEEYVIPGVGVYYASTCMMCDSGCGIHTRVREGRALKIEGNPDSPVNKGKTCQMGQAGVQAHYNPDRITEPMLREGGSLKSVSWEKAIGALKVKTASAGNKVAWFTGSISGHQSALIQNYLDASDASKNHYVHEVVNNAVWQAVCADMLGDSNPKLDIANASLIVSFGADFLATWGSPVHFAGQYATFRNASMGGRGTLIQIESKMSLTGGNADLWVPIKPGTDGAMALGVANYIISNNASAGASLSDEQRSYISSFSLDKAAAITGTSSDYITRVGKALMNKTPSLVLAGASAEGHEKGYDNVAAVMLLNVILGNIGTTIKPSGKTPFAQLAAKSGSTRDLIQFTKAVNAKSFDLVFFSGTNPVYSAPDALGFDKAIKDNVAFKVAISMFPDETTMAADLVLPASSFLEDWGTHVPAYQGDEAVVSIQQPTMENLYSTTKGLGDILITLLKDKQPDTYGGYKDYFAYLQDAVKTMQTSPAVKGRADSAKAFWDKSLQSGLIGVNEEAGSFTQNSVSFKVAEDGDTGNFPYRLVPSPRLGLYDGRHANLPWLQESPDQIAKVVWDTWVEMHPKTAGKLGISHGQMVSVTSDRGTINAKAYVFKGIHPDAIGVPLGQGHEEHGRYAKGLSANPLKILSAKADSKTGELAMYATRVKVAAAGKGDLLVRMGGNDTQLGRRFVRTMPVNVLKRTEGA